MPRILPLLPAPLLLLLLACAGRGGERTVVLLHTTDEHSALLAIGPEADDYQGAGTGAGLLAGGAARRSTLLQAQRAQARAAGAAAFTFSAGDTFTGTLFQAAGLTVATEYRALAALGYDAATFGNHEFDNGPAYLAGMIGAAQARAGMPALVASNIHFAEGDGGLQALYGPRGAIRPSLVLTRDGVRIGVLGCLGHNAAGDAVGKDPVTFTAGAALYQELAAAAQDLRQHGNVDLVVLLAHAGTDPDQPALGESHQIALNVPGIDVVLSGHSHVRVPPYTVTNAVDQRPVVIVEPGWDGSQVARVVLRVGAGRNPSVQLLAGPSALLDVTDALAPDPALKPLVDEAIATLEAAPEWPGAGQSMLERTLTAIVGEPVSDDPAVLGDLWFRPLGHTAFDLPRVLRQESGALRLAADAFLAASSQVPDGKPAWMPEVGLTAYGIVHDGLHQGYTGQITLADAFRTCPGALFPDLAGHATPGNPLVRVAVPLAELKLAFEITALTPDLDVNGADLFMLPAGASFQYDRSLPPIDLANPTDPTRGRVTRIALAAPGQPDLPALVVYDAGNPDWAATGGWNPAAPAPYPLYAYVPVALTTDLYVAVMAMSLGLPLYSTGADPATIGVPEYALTTADLGATLFWRADGSALKSFEAYAAFVAAACAGNGGTLPDRYAAAPSRVLPL